MPPERESIKPELVGNREDVLDVVTHRVAAPVRRSVALSVPTGIEQDHLEVDEALDIPGLTPHPRITSRTTVQHHRHTRPDDIKREPQPRMPEVPHDSMIPPARFGDRASPARRGAAAVEPSQTARVPSKVKPAHRLPDGRKTQPPPVDVERLLRAQAVAVVGVRRPAALLAARFVLVIQPDAAARARELSEGRLAPRRADR